MSGCHETKEIGMIDLLNMIRSLEVRVEFLREHKLRQIDENRKISKRVDELEIEIKILRKALSNGL